MNAGTLTVPPAVARKIIPPTDPPPEDDDKLDTRVEFVADVAWLAQLDKAAKALGIGRSAYIRMAVSRQMASDRRDA